LRRAYDRNYIAQALIDSDSSLPGRKLGHMRHTHLKSHEFERCIRIDLAIGH